MHNNVSMLRFFILSFIVILSFFSVKVIDAKAMANVDVESINLNKNYKVNNESKGYTFKIVGDGLTTISVNTGGSLFYSIYLENEQGVESIRSGEVRIGETSYKMTRYLPKGEYTLYILSDIAENESAPAYEFKVSYADVKNGEKEQNGSYNQAQAIHVNTLYTGSTNLDIQDDQYIVDEDYYKFTIKKSSKVTFVLYDPPFFDDMQDHWNYIILDKNKRVFAKDDYVSVDELNGDYTYTLELPPNDYYIKIKDASSDLRYGKMYSFKIQSKEITTGTEKEWNDTSKTAQAIKYNSLHQGRIYNRDDVDYYKLSIPSNGQLSFDFKGKDYSTEVQLLDKSLNVIQKNSDFFLPQGSTTTLPVNIPKGTYYLKVTDSEFLDKTVYGEDEYYYNHSANRPYQFKPIFKAASFTELELNNDKKSANTIKLNQYYLGRNNADYDYDYYQFSAPSTKNYTILLKDLAFSQASKVRLLDGSGKVAWTYYGNFKDKSAQKTLKLKKGKYYLEVIPVRTDASYKIAVKSSEKLSLKVGSIKSTSAYVSGTTKPNVSVEVLDSKNKVIAKGTSDLKGTYKIKIKKQKKNSYLKLKAKDPVGNQSSVVKVKVK